MVIDKNAGSHRQKVETIGTREWLDEQLWRSQCYPVSLASAGRVFPRMGRVEVLPCPTAPLHVAVYNIHDGLNVPDGWPLSAEQSLLLCAALKKVAEGFCYTSFGFSFEHHAAGTITIYDSFGIDANFTDSLPGYHFEDYALTGAAGGYIQQVMGDGLKVQQPTRLFVGQFASNEELIQTLADRHGRVLVRDVIPTSYEGIHRQAIQVRGAGYE